MPLSTVPEGNEEDEDYEYEELPSHPPPSSPSVLFVHDTRTDGPRPELTPVFIPMINNQRNNTVQRNEMSRAPSASHILGNIGDRLFGLPPVQNQGSQPSAAQNPKGPKPSAQNPKGPKPSARKPKESQPPVQNQGSKPSAQNPKGSKPSAQNPKEPKPSAQNPKEPKASTQKSEIGGFLQMLGAFRKAMGGTEMGGGRRGRGMDFYQGPMDGYQRGGGMGGGMGGGRGSDVKYIESIVNAVLQKRKGGTDKKEKQEKEEKEERRASHWLDLKHDDPPPKPKTAKPKTAKPKTAKPKTAKPKTAKPKTAKPKTAKRDDTKAEDETLYKELETKHGPCKDNQTREKLIKNVNMIHEVTKIISNQMHNHDDSDSDDVALLRDTNLKLTRLKEERKKLFEQCGYEVKPAVKRLKKAARTATSEEKRDKLMKLILALSV
jgi:hypothetical protein